jgi:hypothetical protein
MAPTAIPLAKVAVVDSGEAGRSAVYSRYNNGAAKITNPQLSEGNFTEKEKLVAGPRWAPDIKTDWPTDCRS